MELLPENIVRKLYPLNQLPREALEELRPSMRERWVFKGAEIFRQGDAPEEHIYVLEGSVWLTDKSEQTMQSVQADADGEMLPLPYILPSIHRAQAITEAKLLMVDRCALAQMMVRYGGNQVHGLADRSHSGTPSWQAAMMRASGFQRVSMENLRRVFQLMKPMNVREGQLIFRQDTPEDDFYVIAEGRCEVIRSFKPHAEPAKIAELGIGDTLGEDSLVSHTPHNSTCRMLTDGVLMRLDADDFRLLIKRALSHPVTHLEAAAMIAAGARWFDVRLPSERSGRALPGAFAMPHVIARCLPFKGSNYQRYVVACSKGFDAPAVAFALCKHGYDAYWLKGGLDAIAEPAPFQASLQWQAA